MPTMQGNVPVKPLNYKTEIIPMMYSRPVYEYLYPIRDTKYNIKRIKK